MSDLFGENQLNAEKRNYSALKKGPGKRVLLVEDSVMTALHIEGVFRIWNISVDVINDSKTAVRKVLSNSYDAVLIDIPNAEYEGLEDARQIRTMRPESNLLMVALLAKDLPEHMLASYGFSNILRKPLSTAVLEKLCFTIALD